jgi:hypothetical protein
VGPFVSEGADRRKTSAFVGIEHAFDVLEMTIGHGEGVVDEGLSGVAMTAPCIFIAEGGEAD